MKLTIVLGWRVGFQESVVDLFLLGDGEGATVDHIDNLLQVVILNHDVARCC